ncbi:putative TonB dependent receptor domain protein [Xanthomonas citri pv. punicae str. LMG 859]|nr:putative TonB dependent receptor domain protein [Xanthomonas citri pv. punicae str. LMG 859]
MFIAHRNAQIASRQLNHRTGQVCGEAGGLGQAGIGEGREQEFLQRRVGKRALTCNVVRQQRIPRTTGRQRDRVCSGTTLRNALAVDEGRAQCLTRRDEAHVATAALGVLVAVPQRTHVPVPGLAADVEVATQGRREAQGLELVFAGARHFPQTATEVDILADRIERAAAFQRSAERTGLIRVARDLSIGRALVVGNIGVEGDGIGNVVVDVGEHRLPLDTGLHHHLLVRVGVLGRRDAVIVGRVVRVAAGVERLPHRGVRIIAVDLQRIAPRTVLADRAPAVRGRVGTTRTIAAEPTVLGEHRVLLGIFGRQRRATALALRANSEGVLRGVAVALAELAELHAGFSTVETLTRDDVDHTGDRVGAVDGRGAVLQHFNTLDCRHRNLAEILQTGGRRTQTLTVHQHQRTLRAEIAQVDVVTANVFA